MTHDLGGMQIVLMPCVLQESSTTHKLFKVQLKARKREGSQIRLMDRLMHDNQAPLNDLNASL